MGNASGAGKEPPPLSGTFYERHSRPAAAEGESCPSCRLKSTIQLRRKSGPGCLFGFYSSLSRTRPHSLRFRLQAFSFSIMTLRDFECGNVKGDSLSFCTHKMICNNAFRFQHPAELYCGIGLRVKLQCCFCERLFLLPSPDFPTIVHNNTGERRRL